MSDNETVEIITHGPRCSNWPNPQTYDEWMAAQLVKDEVEPGDHEPSDASGVWRCPFCRRAVYVFFDYGELEFGFTPRENVSDDDLYAFIETFEPVTKPPE